MDTHAIQILLHYQDSESVENKNRFESFLDEVRDLAKKHEIDFDQFESFILPGTEYTIAPCRRCSDLTIDAKDIDEGIKEMVPYFWEFIKLGAVSEGGLLCQTCKNWE